MTGAHLCNLLEEPSEEQDGLEFDAEARTVRLRFAPFQIVTVLLTVQ